RALIGQCAGPWSAGTAANLFLRAAGDPLPAGRVVATQGGPGALTAGIAKAARAAGAEIRTGVEVTGIETRDGAGVPGLLTKGDRIETPTIVSGLDPKRTFLRLLDPAALDPAFRAKIRNIRARGVTARVNLALKGLPSFTALKSEEALTGRIVIGGSIDDLER